MKKIITYGTYDLLHQEHINLLSKKVVLTLHFYCSLFVISKNVVHLQV